MRTTLAQARASRIPIITGLCPSDSRLPPYINEAQRRLLVKGDWWGTFQKIRLCVVDNCFTWPREVAALRGVNICDSPLPIRNQWYEFMETVHAWEGCDSEWGGGLAMSDRGMAPTFSDILGTGKKIKVYASVAELADAKILLQGFDENNLAIRTFVDDVWVDGEYVSINAAAPATSVNFFSILTGVQKPITNGSVRLFEYDTLSTAERGLALYQPDEETPAYRRTYINVSDVCSPCGLKTVTAMAKLEFIPAVKDTDYLLIGNLDALKDMVQSIMKTENNLSKDALVCEARAIHLLNAELRNNTDRDQVPVTLRVHPRGRLTSAR